MNDGDREVPASSTGTIDRVDADLPIGGNPASRAGRAGRGCATLFFGVFFAMGALFTVVILGEALRELEPWTWPETQCTITASGVAETGDDQRPYRAEVRYRYEIEGRDWEGARVVRSDQGSASFDRARRRADRYPPGASATCRVDPDHPSIAVLERRLPWIAFVVAFPMIFVAVGAGGIWAVWRRAKPADGDGVASISQLAQGRGSSRLVLIVGLIFVAIGGGLVVPLFGLPALRLANSLGWSPTPCTVVASRLRSWSTDDGTSYRADVMYEYSAGGRSWRSNRVDFFAILSSGRDAARTTLDRYPPGAVATCWVDRDDPSRSVLERRLRPIHFLGLLPLLFLLAGAALAAQSRERMRAAAAGPFEGGSAAAVETGSAPVVLEPSVGPLGKLAGSLFFALFWNGIVSVFVWQAWKSWERGHPDWFLTVFLVPFVLIGLASIAFVGHFALALANPRPRLTVDSAAPSLGDRLGIDWQFSGRASRIRRLRIVLEGREEATYQRGTDTHTDREVFATHVLVDTANDWEISRGSASLVIPDDTMHSFEAAANKIVWELKVAGEIARWPDVDESFPVTIHPIRLQEV